MPKISELAADTDGVDGDAIVPIVEGGTNEKVTKDLFLRDAQFPPILGVSTSTLTLDRAVHLGKILMCTHADGCAITVPDDEFEADDWVQAFGTLDERHDVEGGTMAIEPSLASRDVNVRVELLFSAAAVATLNGDIQL